ncbi:MAG: AIR synthase related protein [Asgard group archaeon]|nr:AIR synthase related protein [Asgard group archaeon]
MKEGKLAWELLQKMLRKTGYENKGIVQGAKAGCDAAVINYQQAITRVQEFYESDEEVYLVYKSDPITFPTTNPGKYAVIVNSNDVVTTGALPFGFNATIIVPSTFTSTGIAKIQEGIHQECLKYKISVLGGHTEISSSVNSVVVSGSMFGFVPKDHYVTRDISEGEVMVCIGYCAKEGMGIIASEGYETLLNFMESSAVDKLLELGNDICVMEEALTTNKHYHPSMIHDATEGGVVGAAYETIATENFGIALEADKFSLTRETKEVCALLDVDPLRVISSGTLLVVTSEEQGKKMEKESTKDIPKKIVGRIQKPEKGITLDGEPTPPPQPDEIIKALNELKSNNMK